jgi:hypothetical protein
VGVRAVVLAILANLLAFLGITVPVVEAVLLVGVNVSFLFFAAAGNCQCSDKGEGYVEGAFSSHGSLHYSLVKNDWHKCTLNLYNVNNSIELDSEKSR